MSFNHKIKGGLFGLSIGLLAGYLLRDLMDENGKKTKDTIKIIIKNGIYLWEIGKESLVKISENISDLVSEVDWEIKNKKCGKKESCGKKKMQSQKVFSMVGN